MLVGARDVAPILIGVVPFGLVAGAAVVTAGFGLPEAIGMSLIVCAGASQIVATQLTAQGAPFIIALGTALIVNARMFIYATSIAPVLGEAPGWQRPFLGHMLVDQNYAATMTKGRFRTDVDIVPYYVGAWLALWTVWQTSSIAGALIGAVIPPSWQLDFAVPLVFLAMLAPALKGRVEVEVAVIVGVASALLVPVLPMQTGLIVAMVAGMALGAWRGGPAPQPASQEETDALVDEAQELPS
jgi:4-azaleucine resistance transporter AzlC